MKRETFLWPLTQSHHRALVTAKRVREKLSDVDPKDEPARVEEMSAEIRKLYGEELQLHFWDEEKMLVLYEGHMGGEEPEPGRIRKEHRFLEALLAKPDRASLLQFAETLTAHVRFEEDVLFGKIEKALDEAEKQALGKLLQSTPAACAKPS